MADPTFESAYRAAVLAARDRGYALGRANVQLVEQAFRDAIRQLTRQIALDDNPLTAARAEELRRQLIAVLEQLERKVAASTARGVTLTVEDVVQIHRDALSQLVPRVLGSTETAVIVGRLDVVATRAASILASIRPAATFQTLVRRHLLDAAPDLDRLLVSAVARGASSRTLAAEIVTLLKGATPPEELPSDVAGLRTLKSDATRIARSEIMNALREAGAQSAAAAGIVQAQQWQLSGNHATAFAQYGPCGCDVLARLDLWGFGEGFYPPEHWPLAPHPHCACYAGRTLFLPPSEWAAPKRTPPARGLGGAEVWPDAETDLTPLAHDRLRREVEASLARRPFRRKAA